MGRVYKNRQDQYRSFLSHPPLKRSIQSRIDVLGASELVQVLLGFEVNDPRLLSFRVVPNATLHSGWRSLARLWSGPQWLSHPLTAKLSMALAGYDLIRIANGLSPTPQGHQKGVP